MFDTFRQPAVPVLLMAIPLIIIGILAYRASEADRAMLEAEQAEAATSRLRLVNEIAQAAVERIAGEAIANVAARTDAPDGALALRGMILSGAIDFATAEDEEHGQVPSEGSPESLHMEQQRLRALAAPLANLRAELVSQGDGPAKAWTWVAEAEGPALLHCRRQASARIICVLLSAARVNDAVGAALNAGLEKSELWALALADTTGARVWAQGRVPQPADATLWLSAPLHAWQAQAHRLPSAAIGDRRPVLLAIIMPLLASWLSLAWVFYRTQRDRLQETRRRAEIATQFSHDLRTPLSNLRLYAELIARKAGDCEATRDYCRIVDEEAARLSLLADNAVAIATGDAGEMAEHGAASPAQMVRAILTRLHPLLDSAGCIAKVTNAADEAVIFNLSAFDRIVTNLLDNARKFAPNSVLDITTRVEGDALILSIRDYGPGLREKPQGGKGFGLGLATVRRLACANGGDARISDAEPGTRATIRLRCAPVRHDEAAPCLS